MARSGYERLLPPVAVAALLTLATSLLLTPVGLASPPSSPTGPPASASSPGTGLSAAGAPSPGIDPAPAWHSIPIPLGGFAPSPRAWAAMAFDPADPGVVLFGGYDPTYGALGDTWLFQHGQWSSQPFVGGATPPARWGAVLVWDPALSGLLLFGGRTSTQFYNDTWLLSATGWSLLPTSSAPTERAFSTGFWDGAQSRLLILDGGCATCSPGGWFEYNDSWAFANGTWTNVTASIGPMPPRVQITYSGWDPIDNQTILFGGQRLGGVCADFNSTWTYQNGWTEAAPTTSPGTLVAGAAAWDGVDGFFLIYGGQDANCQVTHETWSYVHGEWTNRTNLSSGVYPLDRCCNSMAYDPVQKLVVMFGGAAQVGYFGDTWTYPAAPLSASIASSSLAAAGRPSGFSAAVSGGAPAYSFSWDFGDGTPNATGATAAHPFALAGSYLVHLEVTDGQGRTANASVTVRVYPPLVATLATTGFSGRAPLNVTFSVVSSGGAPPQSVTYRWNFGDGNASEGTFNTTSHIFTTPGTYTVNISVSDAIGEYVNLSVNGTVLGPPGTPGFLGIPYLWWGVIAGVVVVAAVAAFILLRRGRAASGRAPAGHPPPP